MIMSTYPVNCPICGAKAFVYHFKIPEGDFGWDAGCPRFKNDDKYHHIGADDPDEKKPRVMGMRSRIAAINEWNKKAEKIRKMLGLCPMEDLEDLPKDSGGGKSPQGTDEH